MKLINRKKKKKDRISIREIEENNRERNNKIWTVLYSHYYYSVRGKLKNNKNYTSFSNNSFMCVEIVLRNLKKKKVIMVYYNWRKSKILR